MSTIAPPLTEVAFMDQVTQYAELRGWETFHVRAGRTLDSWRTPGSGTMAKGWPDLVLCREHDRRLIFAELKREAGKVTADQERVLDMLGRLDDIAVEVYVWRPSGWASIEELLR